MALHRFPGRARTLTRAVIALLISVLTLSVAGCSGSSSGGGTSPPPPVVPPPPPPPPPPGSVTISGNLSFEMPLPNVNCAGLNFVTPDIRPIRQATVQLLNAAGTTVLDSTVSDDNGAYSVTVASSTNVILRVRAEIAAAKWNVQVRNNVDLSASPPPLAQRPIYAMDQAFNSGTADNPGMDLLATTGWDLMTSSFKGPRVAAPFSILDGIYQGMLLVAAADPTAQFPALDAYWSPDNTTAMTSGRDIDTGEIGTSYYSGGSLFLLGKSGDDIDEFDTHVVVHEWGHYFEDNFSRSDSIGGQHGLGNSLDARVAFGEGWATALAGMALADPQYCDVFWQGAVLTGFGINIESGNYGTAGWFNEASVLKLLYDLWDTNDDGADTSSIGFGPIYAVMTGPESTTAAFTSIFSFATYLKAAGTGQDGFINGLLSEQAINPAGIDIYGSTEINDRGGANDVLPVYTDLTVGVTQRICANSQFDSGRTGNKLSEHRYLKFALGAQQAITVSMLTVNPPSTPPAGYDCVAAYQANPDDPAVHTHSDPDFLVVKDGLIYVDGTSCEPNSEIASSAGALPAGDYVIDLNEFRHADDQTVNPFPERVCFDVTLN